MQDPVTMEALGNVNHGINDKNKNYDHQNEAITKRLRKNSYTI
jgi:hypothetical protein